MGGQMKMLLQYFIVLWVHVEDSCVGIQEDYPGGGGGRWAKHFSEEMWCHVTVILQHQDQWRVASLYRAAHLLSLTDQSRPSKLYKLWYTHMGPKPCCWLILRKAASNPVNGTGLSGSPSLYQTTSPVSLSDGTRWLSQVDFIVNFSTCWVIQRI